MTARDSGKIVSFYSYKGGTGRSMAMANVAWLLASRGQRVLVIDWDLEAPGLHRYFEPFLADKSLENSTGLIDFVLEFASAAVSQTKEEAQPDWYLEYANILAHAMPVAWDFPTPGLLHMVPAGRQDSAYAVRVNSFDWKQFYEKLGGGIWLEAVKRQMRERYDFILIDSRTGVSDTSGVCTVQMPDQLVVCFTLNQQSMAGASAVAYSALQQRRAPDGSPTLRVWPLPMRVEDAEQERLELARAIARTRFSRVLGHLSPSEQDRYWGDIEVAYYPLYAYEEILAVFGDRPRQSRSLLASMEKLVSRLLPETSFSPPMSEERRLAGWRKFTARTAAAAMEDLKLICEEYERIRRTMNSSDERTYLMDSLVERAGRLAGEDGVAQVAEALFKTDTDGGRVIGLSLAARDPSRAQIDMALSGIAEMRSPFEQYYALLLAERLVSALDPTSNEKLRAVIELHMSSITVSKDSSRFAKAKHILSLLEREQTRTAWKVESPLAEVPAGGTKQVCVEISSSSPYLQYADVSERHGPWVNTRGTHSITLPKLYRIGRALVTNADYESFVSAGGYKHEEFWPQGARNRARMLTADGETQGPADWRRGVPPEGKNLHPVSGICFHEAQAFIEWLNSSSRVPGWRWTLPSEDMWEYAARTETGLTYPWGDAFESHRCNSLEAGIGETSSVESFAAGASRHGCRDMAGNVWEFVISTESADSGCVLRGGSYKNDRFEVRSYLRLFGVPLLHRPPDFGFRVAQVLDQGFQVLNFDDGAQRAR